MSFATFGHNNNYNKNAYSKCLDVETSQLCSFQSIFRQKTEDLDRSSSSSSVPPPSKTFFEDNNHDRKIKTQNLEKRFGCHFTKKRELMWPGSQWCHCNINLIKLWGNKVDFLMIKSRPCSVWKVGLNEQIFSFIFGLFQATISRALVLWFEFTTPLITSLYP